MKADKLDKALSRARDVMDREAQPLAPDEYKQYLEELAADIEARLDCWREENEG